MAGGFTLTQAQIEELNGGLVAIHDAITGQFGLDSAEIVVRGEGDLRYKLTNSGRGWSVSHVPEESPDANPG